MIPKSFKPPKNGLPIVTVTDISKSCMDFFGFQPAGQRSRFSEQLSEISVTVTIGNPHSEGLKRGPTATGYSAGLRPARRGLAHGCGSLTEQGVFLRVNCLLFKETL